MNADQKEFKEFLKHYSNAEPEQEVEQKVAEGRAAMARMFGGR